jgi:hypothetical protein
MDLKGGGQFLNLVKERTKWPIKCKKEHLPGVISARNANRFLKREFEENFGCDLCRGVSTISVVIATLRIFRFIESQLPSTLSSSLFYELRAISYELFLL